MLKIYKNRNKKKGDIELLENKFTNEDLKIMQSWSLEQKIKTTQAKIIEFGDTYSNKIYVSFSGGKDSTVLLDLVRRVYPDTLAVFVDTGLEYPEIREFVKTIPNVITIEPEMNFKKVITTYGYPLISKEVSQKIYESRRKPDGCVAARFENDSAHVLRYGNRFSMAKWRWLRDSNIPISHKCCEIMKKKPAKKFERKTGLHPMVATMASESALRKTKWLRTGCNAFDVDRPISTPMAFWTEQDVLEYLHRFNVPYASVYGEIKQDENGKYYTTGCERTGCMFCGFGAHLEKEPNRFQRLKQTHPQTHEWIMKPMDDGGLGMREVLEYVGVKVE